MSYLKIGNNRLNVSGTSGNLARSIAFKIKLSSGDENFYLSLDNRVNYKTTIYWGDDSNSFISGTGNDSVAHTYPTISGDMTFTIRIKGIFPYLDLSGRGDEEISYHPLIEVLSFGDPEETKLSSINLSASNVSKLPNESGTLKYIQSFSYVFSNSKIVKIPRMLFSNITTGDFSYAFYRCFDLVSIPSVLFDNINLTNVENIFDMSPISTPATSLTGNAIDLWNTTKWPNIVNHDGAYSNCTTLDNYSSIPTGWK
jgi:hypothetical protein